MMVWRGAWVNGTLYYVYDVVEHSGSSYWANTQGVHAAPPNSNWTAR